MATANRKNWAIIQWWIPGETRSKRVTLHGLTRRQLASEVRKALQALEASVVLWPETNGAADGE